MAFEIKPGKGGIFKNHKKDSDKHPDWTGQIRTPEGHLYNVALWLKDGKKGQFFSASVSEPRDSNYEPPF